MRSRICTGSYTGSRLKQVIYEKTNNTKDIFERGFIHRVLTCNSPLTLKFTKILPNLGVTGVAVGAILSDYQRVRVESVCLRLGLTPLAYLWQRDQSELLQEMVLAGMESVLVKVACLGLDKRHLGKR